MRGSSDCGGRRILSVFPHYTSSFGMFEHAYPLMDGVRALMPPQGLLVVMAALPASWEVRFVDENIERAKTEDIEWADAVFVSGMHAQRRQIEDICRRVHAACRTAVLGGPSVSGCPEYYPDFDYLHVGELGDATDELVARLARDPSRPGRQVVLTTRERRELSDFPLPAYELARLDCYLTGSIQYSSGCPYQCEFCDIPALYGRTPRLKTPGQITAELDKLVACGLSGAVYFVDDNFIAHRRAVCELLPHLVEWQRRNGYVFCFSCEATLNIAKRPEILELMREALFETVFCGIETPEPEALRAISKDHNLMVPILDAVRTSQSLRHRGCVRHHPRPRHRYTRYRQPHTRIYRAIPDPHRHHQPAAGAAAHSFVGPPAARAADSGRRRARIECGFPPALRAGRRDLARLHGASLPAEGGLCPLPAPGDRDLYQSATASKQSAAGVLAQHPTGLAHALPDPVGSGDAWRLSTRILEICVAASGSRRHRSRYPCRPDGPSYDTLRARCGGRSPGCIPLLLQTCGGVDCPGGIEGGGASMRVHLPRRPVAGRRARRSHSASPSPADR